MTIKAVDPGPDMSDFDAGITPIYRVDAVLDDLDDVRAAALRAALTDQEKYSSRLISRVVAGWGHSLSRSAIDTYRAKKS